MFKTTDADLAAYLYARAYPLLGNWTVGDLTIFAFPAEAAVSAEAFYEGATVPAKSLLHAVHRLESLGRNASCEFARA
jgi:predicted TPR repeat methyltransferase